MANQKGAALIVVLSLLVGSLVIGLSSMQSSQVDERLAGNQKLASEVQMAAEQAAAIGLDRFREISSVEDISAGEPASVLFGILVSEKCSVANLFLSPVVAREDIRASLIGSAVPNWEGVLDYAIANNKPCEDYTVWPSDKTNYEEPEYSEKYSLLKNDMTGLCDAPLKCSYRYVSMGSSQYIMGVAHFEEDGQVLAESRPVFVEIKLSDPPSNLKWIFGAPPITLLAYIADLSVNGANNPKLTLEGVGGPDILADAGNIGVLFDGFSKGPKNNPTFEPDVAEMDLSEFGLDDVIPIIQALKELSDQGAPGITYTTENPDLDNVEDGVLVVAGNFNWNGSNDFNGTIIVLGPEVKYNGLGNSEFLGSLIHAPLKLINETYDWLGEGEYVDFDKVEEFKVGDWRFLEETDDTQMSVDFNGLGNALLKNDSNILIEVSDNVFGELSDSPVLSWEQD